MNMSGTIGFIEDIVSLVSNQDRLCMRSVSRGAFDLHDWISVKERGELILKHLRAEPGFARMPPQGWPQSSIDTFQVWVSEGGPKRRAERYSEFFRAIDAHTEYFDVYRADGNITDMGPFYSVFWGEGLLLQNQWLKYASVNPSTPILTAQKQHLWQQVVAECSKPQIRAALIAIDDFVCDLVRKMFSDVNTIDIEALCDAFAAFGEDTLPLDQDREDRVRALGNPSDYRLVNDFAKHHRMDTRELWFYWFGHLQCVKACISGQSDGNDTIRTALLAGLFSGQCHDTAFRLGSNRLTRSVYRDASGRQAIISTARIIASQWDAGVQEMETLYHMWKGRIPPV